jgi:hypothetical protein
VEFLISEENAVRILKLFLDFQNSIFRYPSWAYEVPHFFSMQMLFRSVCVCVSNKAETPERKEGGVRFWQQFSLAHT